ncbi:MAG TPA: hypothetical protein VFB34_03375 [Chloroflexota bacterium]|nr:hypothetical protein [Chloroflexota bacterium]
MGTLTRDIEEFSGLRLGPGTLYEALLRLEGQGLIQAPQLCGHIWSSKRQWPESDLTVSSDREPPRSHADN